MPPDTNITVPTVREDYRFGMDSLNPPKKLPAHVQQLLENSYPGMTLKPLNGVKDAFVSTVQLGYGTKDSYFQQRGVYVEAGGKEFFFAWHQNATTTDEYALEIWNLTDNTRTKLIYGDYDQSIVYFNMEKLYDAVYITMNYEMATNHISAYRTKNKIVEWDSTASAWVVREMGIDIAGAIGDLVVTDIDGMEYGRVTNHVIVFFKNEYFMAGGRVRPNNQDGSNINKRIYKSANGRIWTYWADCPHSHPVDMTLTVANLGSGDVLVLVGGTDDAGTTMSTEVWSSADGKTWGSKIGDIPAVRSGHSTVWYNGKLHVAGGKSDATTWNDDTYTSSDGVTWSTNAAAMSSDSVHHKCLVFNGIMYLIGGFDGTNALNDVYSSTDSITWTTVTGSAAFGERRSFGATIFDNQMWIFFGLNTAGTLYTDSYYSTDGETWTKGGSDLIPGSERAQPAVFVIQSDNVIALTGGTSPVSPFEFDDFYESSDGIIFVTSGGLTEDYYYDYAITYVRRTDSNSKLASIADYEGSRWSSLDGNTVVGIDETLLTGTIAVPSTAVSGTNTLFTTELDTDDYVRFGGAQKYSDVSAIADNTNMTVDDSLGHAAGTEYSLLPTVGDAITTSKFHPGDIEGIENIDYRKTIKATTISKDRAQVFISLPTPADIADAIAQGATHLRITRTLGNPVKSTAKGLSHRFLVDIAITGDSYTNNKIYIDITTDNALDGETNFLEMTGFSVPPLGRYMIWANNLLWIGGVPGEDGKWFHSVEPGTPGVAFNVRYPQKYASMFDLDEDFVTCDPQDGQRDTGIGWLHGDLYLFKERKIFVVYGGNPNNIPVRISRTIGCACPESIENGDIPNHGEVLFFISDSGPAYITSGGKMVQFTAFTIAELWPKNTGVLTRSNGTPTDWYTRNRVVSRFWNNTWWIFYGDSRDSSNQISGNKVFGYNFSTDGQSIGPFERKQDYGLDHSIYEPKMLMPVDNNRAYTLSHCLDAAGDIHYRLTQFLDPAIWKDTFDEITLAYKMVWQTRYIFAGPKGTEKRKPKKVILFIDFEDDEELKITINIDGTRLSASKVYSQTRQSGLSNSGSDTYRAFIVIKCKENLRAGNFFDIKVEKVVPSNGMVEVFAQEIELYPVTQTEDEFFDTFDDATGSTTFVVKADASPEVEA